MATDEELVLAAAGGDLSAFEQLVVRHQESAFRTAYRFLGNSADAEDVAQEAFLKLFDAADRYRPAAGFRTYLYRIVTRLCIDLSRRNRLRRHHPLAESPDPLPSPEAAAACGERAQAVQEALGSLAPTQRIAVVLRYYENLSYREIAAAMETTEKGVERLLARARESLQKRLGGLFD